MTRIMAVRSAFRVHRYPQAEFTSKVAELSGLDPAGRVLLERLHSNCGVDYRNVVLPLRSTTACARSDWPTIAISRRRPTSGSRRFAEPWRRPGWPAAIWTC